MLGAARLRAAFAVIRQSARISSYLYLPSWDARFLQLEAYIETRGDCLVPRSFVTEGANLGAWVVKQRQAYKKGKLKPDRIEKLQAVSFVWAVRADGWDSHFDLLRAYKAAHGDCSVPRNFPEKEGNKLGAWVNTQRKAFKAGEMSPERIERLEAVSFVWDVIPKAWESHFELLTAYKVAHGNSAVPFRFAAADGTKLGRWVDAQRRVHKAGEMSPERAQRLEAVGFAWRVERHALKRDA
ncbi:helicase-associated [Pelagophyceae sp. CCMP2097]|nr:helicase-associated [Pelagophyceae sp. CCMP2097]